MNDKHSQNALKMGQVAEEAAIAAHKAIADVIASRFSLNGPDGARADAAAVTATVQLFGGVMAMMASDKVPPALTKLAIDMFDEIGMPEVQNMRAKVFETNKQD